MPQTIKKITGILFHLLLAVGMMNSVYWSVQLSYRLVTSPDGCCGSAICCCVSAGASVCSCDVSSEATIGMLLCGIPDGTDAHREEAVLSADTFFKAVLSQSPVVVVCEQNRFFGQQSGFSSSDFHVRVFKPPQVTV